MNTGIYPNQEDKNHLPVYILGVYAPITKEGNIMVEEVLASCYAFTDHAFAHIGMTSIRGFPWMTEWIFGEENGFPALYHILKKMGSIILPYDLSKRLN